VRPAGAVRGAPALDLGQPGGALYGYGIARRAHKSTKIIARPEGARAVAAAPRETPGETAGPAAAGGRRFGAHSARPALLRARGAPRGRRQPGARSRHRRRAAPPPPAAAAAPGQPQPPNLTQCPSQHCSPHRPRESGGRDRRQAAARTGRRAGRRAPPPPGGGPRGARGGPPRLGSSHERGAAQGGHHPRGGGRALQHADR
jgi:hypothetical protein